MAYTDLVACVGHVGEPLPTAILGDRRSVSQKAGAEIKSLVGVTPYRFLAQLAGAWVAIIAAIVVAEYFQNVWITALAVIFIATRQNILGLLTHEQCHWLAFDSKRGDRFTNLTTVYPLFITVESYRAVHLAHHRYYFTLKDPDYVRKQGKEWSFPRTPSELFKTILLDLLGRSLWEHFRSKGRKSTTVAADSVLRVSYYVTLAAILTLTHTWLLFLLYWVLPFSTVFQVIIRWGAICEHKYNLINPTVAESTPIIVPQWWEYLLLPNLNFTLHAYHHYFPGIPYHRLPQVDTIFRREGLVNDKNVFHSYKAYLSSLIKTDATRGEER